MTKPNPENCKNCSSKCAYDCAQLTPGRTGYIGITVHTFANWEAKSYLLQFAAFKGFHTGAWIAAELEKVIEENGIHGKVVHIVSDNASNMRKAFEALREKAMEGDEDDEVGSHDMLDDDIPFEDLYEDEGMEVSHAIDRHCLSRRSCSAHLMQLAIKDAMEKCASVRERAVSWQTVAIKVPCSTTNLKSSSAKDTRYSVQMLHAGAVSINRFQQLHG